jgi:hypothetical protein
LDSNLLAEMTKALAWPVATLVLALLFRQPIISLVSGLKLRRLKGKDWEAEFGQALEEARREIPAPTEAPRELSELAPKLQGSIATSPSQAILRAWNEVEGFLVSSVAQEIAPSGFVVPDVVESLVEKGIIERSTRDAIVSLYHLRNLATHAPSERISPLQAREFVAMASAVKWAADQNIKKYLSRHGGVAGPGIEGT